MRFGRKGKAEDEPEARSESPEETAEVAETAEAAEAAEVASEEAEAESADPSEHPGSPNNTEKDPAAVTAADDPVAASAEATARLARGRKDVYLVLFDGGGSIKINPFLRVEDAQAFLEQLIDAGHAAEGIAAFKARGLTPKVNYRPLVEIVSEPTE